jgi:hypothetical protein
LIAHPSRGHLMAKMVEISMDSPYAAIPGLEDTVGLHRVLHGRLHLPRNAADAVVRTVKYGLNPAQASIRRRLAQRIAAGAAPGERIAEDKGYLAFAPGYFPGAAAAFDRARARFAELSADGTIEETQRTAKKQFLLSVINGAAFLDYPEILSFMISRPVVDLASIYMGAVPVLSSARLWWTPPNDSEQQSQLFHRDGEDDRQIKFFFNLFDVTEQMGPLTFLSADVSESVKRNLGYNAGKVTDQAIDDAGGRGNHIVATGPAGGGVALDTSRCLHYGSRHNTVGRLILMFQFTSFYAPKAERIPWADGIARAGLDPDEVQKLVLGLA